MTLRRTHIFILILSLLILVPTDAAARKKNRNGNKSPNTERTQEPDALANRSRPERPVTAAVQARGGQHRGNVNQKYKEGIDVSHYQGRIDWKRVGEGSRISYVYIKATEGSSYVDDTYRYNLQGAKAAGLSVGSYHFYRPNVSPEEQLANIRQNILPDEQDLVPIIDIEHRGNVSEEKFIADLTTLLQGVEKLFGRKPLLYSYQNFYNRHFTGRFRQYEWMIAKYQSEPPILTDGRDFVMWQYTSKGSMPGINGHVDRSCLMDHYQLSVVAM